MEGRELWELWEVDIWLYIIWARGRPSYLISHKTGYSTRGVFFFFNKRRGKKKRRSPVAVSSELFDNNNNNADAGVAAAKLNGLDWSI